MSVEEKRFAYDGWVSTKMPLPKRKADDGGGSRDNLLCRRLLGGAVP